VSGRGVCRLRMVSSRGSWRVTQVIIEGFKSYKEQVAIEPFSPKHNCIGACTHSRISCDNRAPL
jgi:hypothetical protein